jgi:hypothetical protein
LQNSFFNRNDLGITPLGKRQTFSVRGKTFGSLAALLRKERTRSLHGKFAAAEKCKISKFLHGHHFFAFSTLQDRVKMWPNGHIFDEISTLQIKDLAMFLPF